MAIRRETRLRKEFLFKREIDAQVATKSDKKRKIQEAIDEGKSIPTELREDARTLYRETELDIARDGSAIDDEYAQAGGREPKVCVTTSRDPGSRLKQFAK
jgi:U3 small nucleolar ribonucleoprotein protein IMP4